MSPTSSDEFDKQLGVAHQLADRSAAAILRHFRTQVAVDDKGSGVRAAFDPVTVADREGEQAIRRQLQQEYPDHSIVGEEFGVSTTASRYRWIIDPIDGTRAFMMGLPTWGTLIGLADGARPLLGIMNQPFTGERYWSERDHSMLRSPHGEQRLATRACGSFDDAILAATSPTIFKTEATWNRFLAVSHRCRMTRFGGDCYAYCLLAAGLVDLVIEADLKTYDIAALIPIIERAGGRVTNWDGGAALEGGSIVAAGDPRLHEQAVNILSG